MSERASRVPAQDRHQPVLVHTCTDLLLPALSHEGAVFVDATLGMGGHTVALLSAAPGARAIGIDRDAAALELAQERIADAGFADRVTYAHTTYDNIGDVLAEHHLEQVDAVIMDLGLSSFQIDTAERGFSYAHDAPLDMRMDPSEPTATAADLLSTLSASELATILREYGDERHAMRIARAVVAQREHEPLTSSAQLVELLDRTIPAPAKRTGGHVAKRTFQALRIAVNDELKILQRALDNALDSVRPGGRIVVEAYHSGEDRLVKDAFQRRTRSQTPVDLPVELDAHKPQFRELVRGAIKASDADIADNPRATSVRVRALERIPPTPRPC